MNAIGYTSYKHYLKDYLNSQRDRGAVGRLAEIIDCDRTYVSQVLSGKADLLPDHIAKLSKFLALDRWEADYLMTLLLKDRASKPEAVEYFEVRLEQIVNESIELSKKYTQAQKEVSLTEKEKTLYYSNIYFQLVHILTSIREFQNVAAIAKKLGLPESEIQKTLKVLSDMNLVVLKRGLYVHSGKTIYIDRHSPQVTALHLNARLLAVQRAGETEDIHFSHIFSVGKKDMKDLKLQLSRTIDQFRNKIHESGSEQVGLFCCDFFQI